MLVPFISRIWDLSSKPSIQVLFRPERGSVLLPCKCFGLYQHTCSLLKRGLLGSKSIFETSQVHNEYLLELDGSAWTVSIVNFSISSMESGSPFSIYRVSPPHCVSWFVEFQTALVEKFLTYALAVPSVSLCKRLMRTQVGMNVHGAFFKLLLSS